MSEPLIFDTSVWIDVFRNKRTTASELLAAYIERNDPVLLVPTILQEILQGIREDAQYNYIRDILSYFTILQVSSVEAAIGAADLYRMLRKKGLTIRKSNDCLIAWYAITFSTTLVHSDSDFDVISVHAKLRTRKTTMK
jgi:predicted nucleic acid-binding protein